MAFGFARGLFRRWYERIMEGFRRRAVGLLTRVPRRLVPVVRERIAPRLRETYRREFEREITWRTTRWTRERVVIPLEEVTPGPNQWLTADVTLIGRDGQVIHLTLDTFVHERFRPSKFRRRLAAELKHMENTGLIEPIGRPTPYVRRALLSIDWYLTTSTPIEPVL